MESEQGVICDNALLNCTSQTNVKKKKRGMCSGTFRICFPLAHSKLPLVTCWKCEVRWICLLTEQIHRLWSSGERRVNEQRGALWSREIDGFPHEDNEEKSMWPRNEHQPMGHRGKNWQRNLKQKSEKNGTGCKIITEVKSGVSPRVQSYLLPLDRLSEANSSWIGFGFLSLSDKPSSVIYI